MERSGLTCPSRFAQSGARSTDSPVGIGRLSVAGRARGALEVVRSRHGAGDLRREREQLLGRRRRGQFLDRGREGREGRSKRLSRPGSPLASSRPRLRHLNRIHVRSTGREGVGPLRSTLELVDRALEIAHIRTVVRLVVAATSATMRPLAAKATETISVMRAGIHRGHHSR
jgi:hypothetical protein